MGDVCPNAISGREARSQEQDDHDARHNPTAAFFVPCSITLNPSAGFLGSDRIWDAVALGGDFAPGAVLTRTLAKADRDTESQTGFRMERGRNCYSELLATGPPRLVRRQYGPGLVHRGRSF